MKLNSLNVAFALLVFLTYPVAAEPPAILIHQGRIAVSGVNYDGTGHFKFALVNRAGDQTYWTNDGTNTGAPGGEPTGDVTAVVTKGHYSIPLGDTDAGMGAVPASVFADNSEVYLRVWFKASGEPAFELLTPDRRFGSNGYAFSASTAATASMVKSGSIDSSALAPGVLGTAVGIAGGTQVAVANTRYLASGSSPVFLELPAPGSANVGDTVKITGTGTGGWKIGDLNSWLSHDFLGMGNWSSVAMSDDGTTLAATYGGEIQIGFYWEDAWDYAGGPSNNWTSIAVSGDGTTVVAASDNAGGGDGKVYLNINNAGYFATPLPASVWSDVAVSQDGKVIIAAAHMGQLYVSTDGGAFWTPRESSRSWSSVAVSDDGYFFYAATSDPGGAGRIYVSDNTLADPGVPGVNSGDYGQIWGEIAIPGFYNWGDITCSEDGSRVAALDRGNGNPGTGLILTSTNSGGTWTIQPNSAGKSWWALASSDDGLSLVAVEGGSAPGSNPGRIYTSIDGGVNWTPRESERSWWAVASSGDGSRIMAAEYGGKVYTLSGIVEQGGRGEEATLQYLGNGEWGIVQPHRLTSNAFGDGAVGSRALDYGAVTRDAIDYGAVTSDAIADGSIGGSKLGAGAVGSGQIADGSVSAVDLDSTIGLWQVNGGDVYRSSGKVGIGNPSPVAALHIAQGSSGGNIQPGIGMILESASDALMQFVPGPTGSSGIAFGDESFSLSGGLFYNSTKELQLYTNFQVRVTVEGDGDVGIGTNIPTEKLDVAGSVKANDLKIGTATLFTGSNRVGLGTTNPDANFAATVKGVDVGSNRNGLLKFRDHTDTEKWHLNLHSGGLDFVESGVEEKRLFLEADGNVGIGVADPTTKLHVGGDITCVAVNLTSDRNAKENFEAIDAKGVLEKVVNLPISKWQYKEQGPVRHIGPMAQDFREAFSLGRDEKHISSVDADGVALAAIQGLNEKLEEKEEKIEELSRTVERLEKLVEELARKSKGGGK